MLALASRPQLAPYFLPALEVSWAILTFCQSRVTKPWHLYIIRALVGFTEAPSCELSGVSDKHTESRRLTSGRSRRDASHSRQFLSA